MSGTSRLYNLIAILFLVLTILACILVVFLFVQPSSAPAADVSVLPTGVVLPSLTPSSTATRPIHQPLHTRISSCLPCIPTIRHPECSPTATGGAAVVPP